MDNYKILNLKKDMREMQVQHNRLTTLCAVLLKNIKLLREDLENYKSSKVLGNTSQSTQSTQLGQMGGQSSQRKMNKYSDDTQDDRHADERHADEILRQLSYSN
jgi:hypothetical protein